MMTRDITFRPSSLKQTIFCVFGVLILGCAPVMASTRTSDRGSGGTPIPSAFPSMAPYGTNEISPSQITTPPGSGNRFKPPAVAEEPEAALGWRYATGTRIEQSDDLAAAWFTKSAQQGFALGEFALGYILLSGRGIPKNIEKAIAWLEKSAAHGLPHAEFLLGLMAADGVGMEQNQT